MEYVRKKQTTTPTSVNPLLNVKDLSTVNPLPNVSQPMTRVIQQPIVKPMGQVKKPNISKKLDILLEKIENEEKRQSTKKEKKGWKFPFKWKRIMNKSLRNSPNEKVLCFFINRKGELEKPVLLPIYNGNALVYKHTIHEIDPRDILTLPLRRKIYKLLIYRTIDRKAVSSRKSGAVSNRDYGAVKKRGDSTMDDEVFLKAMLTAKLTQIAKQQIGKGALIVVAVAVAGILIWFFSRS